MLSASGDAGGGLIAAGVAAVGVALGVPDEHRHVRVVDVLVHDHVVALGGVAKVYQVVVVLAVVAGDLAGGVELAEQLGAQDGLHLGHGGPGRPLENSSSTSFCSTPAAYSSSRQARMATFRWLVGWLPPF